MPKLIRTSNSDTFMVDTGDAQWMFPCILFPGFAAMFLVLRNHARFDDCVARVCRRVNRSMDPILRDDVLFFEVISDDNDISFAQYAMIFKKVTCLIEVVRQVYAL